MKFNDFTRRWVMRTAIVAVLLVIFLALVSLISRVRSADASERPEGPQDTTITELKYPAIDVASKSVTQSSSKGIDVIKTALEKKKADETKKNNQRPETPASARQKENEAEEAASESESENYDSNSVVVSVLADGVSYNYNGDPVTVLDLIYFYDISIGEDDIVEPSLDTPLENGMIITVSRISYDEVTEMDEGVLKTYLVKYVDGEPTEWEFLSSKDPGEDEDESSGTSSESSQDSENEDSSQPSDEETSEDSTGEESTGEESTAEENTVDEWYDSDYESDIAETTSNEESSDSSSEEYVEEDEWYDSSYESDIAETTSGEETTEDTGLETSGDEDTSEETVVTASLSGPSSDPLTRSKGVNYYGDQKETWYNMDMSNIVRYAASNGIPGEYWVRDDGCKMLGDYIILACNRDIYPYGSLVETSLGTGISLDTGGFATHNPYQVDIAVNW